MFVVTCCFLVKPIVYPSTVKNTKSFRRDVAMGYDWVDVREEGDEGGPTVFPPYSL